jgi:hypothetical protein
MLWICAQHVLRQHHLCLMSVYNTQCECVHVTCKVKSSTLTLTVQSLTWVIEVCGSILSVRPTCLSAFPPFHLKIKRDAVCKMYSVLKTRWWIKFRNNLLLSALDCHQNFFQLLSLMFVSINKVCHIPTVFVNMLMLRCCLHASVLYKLTRCLYICFQIKAFLCTTLCVHACVQKCPLGVSQLSIFIFMCEWLKVSF